MVSLVFTFLCVRHSFCTVICSDLGFQPLHIHNIGHRLVQLFVLVLSQFGVTTLKLEHGPLVFQVLEANVLQLDFWLEVEEIPAFL